MSRNSSDSAGGDIDDYPDGFPVPVEIYVPMQGALDMADDTLPHDNFDAWTSDDRRTRRLALLYPYDFLDPMGVWPSPENIPAPIGQLRKELIKAMAMSGEAGKWEHVEFVPAWTDPDWGDRFIFTGAPGKDPINDPQYQLYAKSGIFQSQRPALRLDDMARSPSEAAKRYGIDPIRVDDPLYGNSGITPTATDFGVHLPRPRATPTNQGAQAMVNAHDYTAMYTQYQQAMAAQRAGATDEGFKQVLDNAAAGRNTILGAACDAEMATALLAVRNLANTFEERQEYQRLMLGGNTSNELVQANVWTMDKTANSDVATPLHDFVTRDKWEVTDSRGGTNPDGTPSDPRKVYSFGTQDGEYCAANDYFWLAIQPALQLVSKILNSEHPATWAWADIYKMRVLSDSRMAGGDAQNLTNDHIRAGVHRKENFSVNLKADPDSWFPETERLDELGFNSVRWVCEMLRECIMWEVNAKYTHNNGGTMNEEHSMAWTALDGSRGRPEDRSRPFIIRISISAEILWPLLVEEYSQAEKAACSFTLAATMVHELAHAFVGARNQLFNPNPLWLNLNSSWAAEIGDEALNNLKIFGYRMVWDDSKYPDSDSVMRQLLEIDYFQGEHEAEEGWATENQYFGGIATVLNAGTFLPETRFISELAIMGCFYLWPRLGQNLFQGIPFDMIEKFFSQNFWDYEVQKWGHEAMKLWPLNAPRVADTWSVFSWRHVELQFGRPARRWLKEVSNRVCYDDEHAVLWNWLHQLTVTAVEPRTCMIKWSRLRQDWKQTDKSLWHSRNKCAQKANAAVAYMQQLWDQLNSPVPLPNPLPPIDTKVFREAFAALSSMHRDLSHEAALCQSMTVDYHRQLDIVTKSNVREYYGDDMRTRLDGIHIRILADCIGFLDLFDTVDQMVLLRISHGSDQTVDLLGQGRIDLRAKFQAVQQLIRPVRLTFDRDPEAYVFRPEDFTGVVPVTAQDTARRFERMAKRQLRTLSGPLLKIAQGWLDIIHQGQRLRNPAAGSLEAAINDRLSRTADFVENMAQIQQQAAAAQHPAPAADAVRTLPNPILQQNQRSPDPSIRMRRFEMAPQGQVNAWQTVYAEASGYVPYQDPRTGLTKFQRADIPDESGPLVNPVAAAQAHAQGQSLLNALAPGGNVPNPAGQTPNPGAGDAFRDLMNVIGQRTESSLAVPNLGTQTTGLPAINIPGLNLPNDNGQMTVGQARALVSLRDLIDQRARQVQDHPEIAGLVVPSIYNQALQSISGPSGEALTNSYLPGSDSLFGKNSSISGLAIQQLEAVIRERALGPNPMAAMRPSAQPGNQQAPQQPHFQNFSGSGSANDPFDLTRGQF